MDNIQINIYTSDGELKKLFLNLDSNTITFNQKNIDLNKSDFIVVTNKILNIVKEWENIELICINKYTRIVVKINLLNNQKEYIFEQKVPNNIYKIYDLIEYLKEKTI